MNDILSNLKLSNLILFLLLILSVISITGCIDFSDSNKNIITVDISGKGDYMKIQDAVDNASNNDYIYVKNGTYYENIVIDKKVNLISHYPNETIIDGNGFEDVIKIIADSNVKLSGFTIINSGEDFYNSGINIRSRECFISNNIFINNSCGIYMSFSRNNTIIKNDFILNFNNGVYLSTASVYNKVSNNSFIKNLVGVRIKGDYNEIIDNRFINNSDIGLYFCCDSKENIAYRNIFNENKKNAYGNENNNKWDNGIIGNYWSDYIGEDLNNDGIGDNPYLISYQNQDNYPIM